MVQLDGLAERLFDEGLAGRVVFRDRIGSGRFIGYNDGSGGEIEVLTPEAMADVRGVSDPLAAIRYVAAHEEGHDYVSDADPAEHAVMDVAAMGRLAQRGDYPAVREGMNLHRERVRTARGSDRQFSEYALALLAGKNMDGGDELDAFRQRYGGGLKEGEKEPGGFFRSWFRYRKRLAEELPFVNMEGLRQYWTSPIYNVLSYITNSINIPEANRDTVLKRVVGSTLDTVSGNWKSTAKNLAFKAFPRIRTYLAHAEGATNISKVYMYEHMHGGTTFEYPVAFAQRVGGAEKVPDTATIQNGINHVLAHNQSPFNRSIDLDRLVNQNWTDYSAQKTTRWDYERHFEHESQRFSRNVVKPFSWYIQQACERDHVTEASLDPSLPVPKIRVYKTDVSEGGVLSKFGKYFFADGSPRSLGTFLYSWLTDITYDVVDTFYDPLEALIEGIPGLTKENVRQIVFNEWTVATNFVRSMYRNPARTAMAYEFS